MSIHITSRLRGRAILWRFRSAWRRSGLLPTGRPRRAHLSVGRPMSVMNIPALFTSVHPYLDYIFRDPVYMWHSRVYSGEGVLHGGTSQNLPSETVRKG